MGNTCKKLQGDEQRCNLLSHNETFERQIYNNSEEIDQLKDSLNNYNKDTSKSLKLIENDIRILRNKINQMSSQHQNYYNSAELYSDHVFQDE